LDNSLFFLKPELVKISGLELTVLASMVL